METKKNQYIAHKLHLSFCQPYKYGIIFAKE